MRKIAALSFKGGVGKTCLACNLAYGLSKRLSKGKRLLAVDIDPQANLSLTLLDGKEPRVTLADVLLDGVDVSEAVYPSRIEGVDVLPADYRLADFATVMARATGRERRLGLALAPLEKTHEIAVLDSPPQLSILTINIAETSNEIIIPVDCGAYSALSVAKLEETIREVQKYLGNETLRIIGILPCKMTRERTTLEILKRLRETYGEMVLKVSIPYSAAVGTAVADNKTVLEWDPRGPAGIAFTKLVAEIANGHAKNVSNGHPAKDRPKRAKRRAG